MGQSVHPGALAGFGVWFIDPGWVRQANGMTDEERMLVERLESLKIEHRDLDDAIARMEQGPYVDQLQLRRLKKRKLQLKDFIALIESRLIPDLDA